MEYFVSFDREAVLPFRDRVNFKDDDNREVTELQLAEAFWLLYEGADNPAAGEDNKDPTPAGE